MLHPIKRLLVAIGALAALALGASAIAGAATSSTTATAPQSSSSPHVPPTFNGPAHGTAAHEDAEKTLTGVPAAKAQAAAIKNVGTGTAGAVTGDFTGSGYETTVTKSDGTKVDVHLDSSYQAMQGGPGDHAAQAGPHPEGTTTG